MRPYRVVALEKAEVGSKQDYPIDPDPYLDPEGNAHSSRNSADDYSRAAPDE